MGILDNLGKKVSQVKNETISRTKEFAESVKLNALISDEEKLQNELYIEIGKKYYSINKSNEDITFKQYFEKLSSSISRVESYSRELTDLKVSKKCLKCGADIVNNAAFCGSCGAKYSEDDVDNKKCTYCNAALQQDATFCTECGKKIDGETI